MKILEKFSLQRRSNPLNNPAVPLSMAGFLAWAFGGEPTASGETVNVQSALQQATVYACVRVLADACASLSPVVYRQTDGGKTRQPNHPFSRMLAVEPNDEMSAYSFWESQVGCLHLTGNSYAEIQRNRKTGRAIGLWPLHPNRTEVKRKSDGTIYYETTDGEKDGITRRIAAENMLHVPLFSLDGLVGISPVALQRQGIGLARAAEKYGAKWFGNGARPGGILINKSTTLSPEQKKQIKDSWQETQGGSNQGRTAVLSGDWSYQSIGISPEDSQFLETRVFQRTEIAGWFKVPPHMVGDTSKMSNNNAEQMNLGFVIDTLRPILMRYELELLRKLDPEDEELLIEFDVSQRLRGDFKTTMDGLAVGKQWGIFNTNRCLAILGQNGIGAVGDVYWSPVNMQNSERLLDTESIQDQPIGETAPNLGDKSPVSAEKKSVLAQYELAFALLFRDAMGRLLHREKREEKDVEQIFTPVLTSIARMSARDDSFDVSGPVSACVRSIATRVKGFEDVEAASAAEFSRAVRSLHINVRREIAASAADGETRHA